jgi:hypothetical protein
MFYWIYDIPAVAAIAAFAALFVAVCWLGTIFSRAFVQSRFHYQPGLNEILGDFLQYFGVIYGLLLGLLAVATYQNHSDVEKTVGNEASSLAALYRDVSAYPDPIRSELEALLRDYTRYVINEAWPLQRKGIVPAGAVKKVAAFHGRLVSFEPETKSQEALHQSTLTEFNTFFEYRRARLYSVTSGIPSAIVVHGCGRSDHKCFHDLAVSTSPWHTLAARRYHFLLPSDLDIADRADGSPVPR